MFCNKVVTSSFILSSSSSSSSRSNILKSSIIQPIKNNIQLTNNNNNYSSSFSSSSTTKTIIKPLIVCGPSGVGKGTIINKYIQEYPTSSNKFGFTVSHTTRQPRQNEINGIHYHFTSMDEMNISIKNNQFLEYANVHGNLYGTSLNSLMDLTNQGKIPLLDIDVQGVKNVKEREKFQSCDDGPILKPKYVFIAPPSLELLLERLVSRGTETEESIQRRTQNAVAEMEYGMTEGNFDAIVVNDDLEQACIKFSNVIDTLYT